MESIAKEMNVTLEIAQILVGVIILVPEMQLLYVKVRFVFVIFLCIIVTGSFKRLHSFTNNQTYYIRMYVHTVSVQHFSFLVVNAKLILHARAVSSYA